LLGYSESEAFDPSRVRGRLTPVRDAGNAFRKGAIVTRNFVDRSMFEALIRATPRKDGDAYEDIATINGVTCWAPET
jgi:hypothetical protein